MLALSLVFSLGARYQLCNFSCASNDERWVACRAEPCTPRLPEDACSDGNEATLLPSFGESDASTGFAVAGPQECETLLQSEGEASASVSSPAPVPIGSFQERCELCMGVVGEAVNIIRLGLSSDGRQALKEGGSAVTCEQAAARIETTLPSVRTCRRQPSACASVLAAARERACPPTFEQLLSSESTSIVRAAQQTLCGELMTQRNASGVDDATVCAVPRDVGARVMAISAVVATCLFAAQWFRV